jgi:hypothetical protein
MKADGDRSPTIRTFVDMMRVLLLLGVLTILSRPGTVRADDCVALGGSLVAGECQIASVQTKSGVFNLDETLRILGTGSITVPVVAGGNSLTLNINNGGDFVIDMPAAPTGGRIVNDDVAATGQRIGATITVNATGDIVLHGNGGAPDARLTSNQPAGDCSSGSRAGNIVLNATAITIEAGALVSANAKCSAGAIELKAGEILIEGTVESDSALSGTGAVRRPGGGPITIDAACTLQISSSGIVRSRGKDPGADLVHLEGGCEVVIEGLVESTGPGHGVPNTPPNHCNSANRPDKDPNPDPDIGPTACIEVWAGDSLIIDASGPNKGEINADTAQSGGHQIAWIDLFANGPISIIGDTGGSFAVHANESISNADGGIITIKSVDNAIAASGRAVQADATASGGRGGKIRIEAKDDITLNATSVFARGDFIAAGGFGSGGNAVMRAFTGDLSWLNGEGDVRPTGDTVPAAQRGVITLQQCTNAPINTGGTTFPAVGTATTPSSLPSACGGAPTLPPYVILPVCTCIRGISIDKVCSAIVDATDLTGTKVRVDFSGKVTNTGTVTLTDLQVTDATQPTISGIIFDKVPASSLPQGQSADYAGHYLVTPQLGVLNFSDTITATAKSQGATVTSQPATASCALTVEPKITVTKECKNPLTTFPNPVEFMGTVCNDGPEQLTTVTITDAPEAKTPPGISLTSTVLNPVDPGKCATYSGSYVPTQVGLKQKDTVTAAGKGKLSGKTAMATASALCDVVGPGMEVTKSCSSAVSSDGKNILVMVNGTIKNTGGVALTITKITDNPPATLTPTKTTIAPNETVNYSGSYTVSSIPVNGLSDTVTIEAKDANNTIVSKDASAQCSLDIAPAVTIDEQCSNPNTPPGSPLEFAGKVCNTGKEELKNLVISDDKGSTITPNAIAALAPPPSGGQSCVTYTGKYTPSGSGAQTNNVKVVGQGAISGKPATGTSFATCTVSSQPAISVTKDCSCVIDSSGTSASIQFTGKVCNDGSENLTNVQIFDDKPSANTLVKTISSLLPGNSNCVSYSGSYPTTTLSNSDVVTATGLGANSGIQVSAQDDAACGCSVNPDITITTACSPAVAPIGSSLSFTGKVCSTGNVALGNVTVVSDKPKPNTNITLSKTTLSALAAGQTPGDAQCVTYSGSYKPSGSGSFSHTVTAGAQSLIGGVTDQASVSAACVIGQSCSPANWVGLAVENSWIGYSPKQKVSSLFSIPSGLSTLGNLTLLQILENPSATDALLRAASSLVKEAVAGLLNAAHPQVNYPIENTATIITQVNAALASGNVTTIKNLTTTFASYNKLGGAPAVCDTTPPPC